MQNENRIRSSLEFWVSYRKDPENTEAKESRATVPWKQNTIHDVDLETERPEEVFIELRYRSTQEGQSMNKQ